LAGQVVADRRWLHRHPELGWAEVQTTAFAAQRLRSLGYSVTDGRSFLADTPRLGLPSNARPEVGLVAETVGATDGPLVALRVDIDALPIREADVSHRPMAEGFASENIGVMHACGHDGHLAMGLAVASIVQTHRHRLKGRFRLIAQPAEEGTRGARAVTEAGWVNDVDVLLAFHIWMSVPSNTIAVGTSGFLATRKYRVQFSGRRAHAGKEPENGRNALVAACQAVLGLQSLAQSSQAGVRLNVGSLQAGEALNVIPAAADFGFEVRALEEGILHSLSARAERLVSMTAEAHEVVATITTVGEATGWENSKEIVRWATQVNDAVGAFDARLDDFVFGASEDATILANAVSKNGGQAGYFVFGADLAAEHHTPQFDFDESVLVKGAAFLAAAVVGLLTTIASEANCGPGAN
jgi:aminobenzoyl-glutamate utilization protein A